MTGSRIIFSPHNSFARYGGALQEVLLRWTARASDGVVAYSQSSLETFRQWGCNTLQLPLLQLTPTPQQEAIETWKARLFRSSASLRLLVAGQIRADKGIDDAIDALAHLGPDSALAIVGEDRGGLASGLAHAATVQGQVSWHADFVPLEDLVAVIAAADIVLMPYRRADQSGIAAIASSLGTRTVCYPSGGLGEQCTVIADEATPRALAAAIVRCSALGAVRGMHGQQGLGSEEIDLFFSAAD